MLTSDCLSLGESSDSTTSNYAVDLELFQQKINEKSRDLEKYKMKYKSHKKLLKEEKVKTNKLNRRIFKLQTDNRILKKKIIQLLNICQDEQLLNILMS